MYEYARESWINREDVWKDCTCDNGSSMPVLKDEYWFYACMSWRISHEHEGPLSFKEVPEELEYSDEFPQKCYLEISDAKRQAMITRYAPSELNGFCRGDIRRLDGEDHRLDLVRKLEDGAFIINWGLPDKKIVTCFRRWLNQNRPCKPHVERRGRTSERDYLKALGARRLLTHLTAEAATTYSANILGGKPLYCENGWFRAKRKANHFLRMLFEHSLFLLLPPRTFRDLAFDTLGRHVSTDQTISR